MMGRSLGAFLVVLALSAPTAAENCPTRDFGKVEEMLRKAPSCDRSYALFEACALGASGDVAFGAAVVERCEGDFLARLKPSQKRAYDREQKGCASKYAEKSGTMYRSFEAFCGAKVARKYARRFVKAAKGTR